MLQPYAIAHNLFQKPSFTLWIAPWGRDMKIIARCHPALESLLPKPVPAAEILPDWLKEMPDQVTALSMGGAQRPSLKSRPETTGAMALGLMILMPTDIMVENAELTWNWDMPMLPGSGLARAPVSPFAPECAQGTPYIKDRVLINFVNFWHLVPPAGCDLLISHPHGFEHLPYRTLSGRIEQTAERYVDLPAALDLSFKGRIAKGTPIAQIVAVPKDCTFEASATV